MNQLLIKKMKTIAFFSTMGVLSFTLMAKPTLKTIKAYLNPAISYTLDGESVLKNAKTITYDNKTYIPLADVAKLMGLDTKFKNDTVIMTEKPDAGLTIPKTKTPITTGSAFEITPETTATVVVKQATIKEIKTENKTVTIFKPGDADKTESYIILNISDVTKIVKEEDKKVYTLADLKAGMDVSVKHSKITSSSLPLQTVAFEIKILAPDKEEQRSLNDVKIIEVNNSGKYIIVEDQKAEGGQLKISFDNKTKVKYQDAKKQPNVNALQAGQTADIKLAGDTLQAKIIEITVKSK